MASVPSKLVFRTFSSQSHKNHSWQHQDQERDIRKNKKNKQKNSYRTLLTERSREMQFFLWSCFQCRFSNSPTFKMAKKSEGKHIKNLKYFLQIRTWRSTWCTMVNGSRRRRRTWRSERWTRSSTSPSSSIFLAMSPGLERSLIISGPTLKHWHSRNNYHEGHCR